MTAGLRETLQNALNLMKQFPTGVSAEARVALDAVRGGLDTLNTRLGDLETRQAGTLDALRRLLEEISEGLESVAQVGMSTEEAEALQEKICRLETDLQTAENRIRELEDVRNRAAEQYESRIRDLEGHLEKRGKTIAEARERILRLQKKTEDFASEKAALEARVRELESTLERRSAALKAAESRYSDLRRRLESQASGASSPVVTQLRALETQIEEYKQANAALEADLARVQQELREKASLVESWEQRGELLKNQYEDAVRELEEARKRLATLHDEADRWRREAEQARQMAAAAEQQIRGQQEEAERLRDQVNTLETEKRELTAQLENARVQQNAEAARQFEEELARVRAELDTVQQQKMTLENDLASVRAEVDRLRNEAAAAAEQLQQADARIVAEQKRVRDLEREKTDLEKRLDAALKEVAKAKEGQESAEKRADTAEQVREELQLRVSTLEAELSERDQTISDLEKRVDQAEEAAARVQAAETEADRLRQEIASIRAALEDAEKQCAEITAAREQLAIDLAEARGALDAQRSETERLAAELNQLQEKLRQDKVYSGLSEVLNEATSELEAVKAQNKQLLRELEELRALGTVKSAITDPQGLRDLIDNLPEEKRRNLGEVLVAAQLITAEQLDTALQYMKNNPDAGSLPLLLVERQQVSESVMAVVMEVFYGRSRMDLAAAQPDAEACRLIPEDIARRYLAVPLGFEGTTLKVAMFNPEDLTALDTLQQVSGRQVISFTATLSEIRQALDRFYWEPE